MFIYNCAAKLQKDAQKSLGKTQKKVAEGESLKIVSESGVEYVIILFHKRFQT